MFSGVRSRMSYANVVATLALVFAMSGGAYAASKYLITSTKQIKPSVLVSLKGAGGKAGPAGAAGAQGATGPQGPAGPGGAQGAKGENGTDGKEGAQGKEGLRGATGPAGATGPQGPSGQTGFTETLPPGKTETGVWSLTEPLLVQEEEIRIPISFPIPLSSRSEHGFFFTAEETRVGSYGSSGCAGTLEHPTAPPGTICVYTAEEVEGELIFQGVFGLDGAGYTSSGTTLVFTAPETVSQAKPGLAKSFGSWAVTAPSVP